MFLSESIMRAIHADRVREIERTTRERRLVTMAAEVAAADLAEQASDQRRIVAAKAARTGRSGLPA